MVKEATRLLMVDDDPESARMVRRILALSGRSYVVDTAPDARRVPTLLSDGAYHAWILDHRLDSTLGNEVLGSLAGLERHPPVVVLSGATEVDLADRYIELGAADFLHKDELTPALLDRTIRFAIAQWRNRRRLEIEAEAQHRRDRMAAIGGFAAGVAHEYNNIDAVLLAGMERLFLGASTDPEIRAQAERVMGAIERGRRISRTLLQLGRAAGPEPGGRCDLRHLVADGVQLLRGEAERARVDLQLQLTAAACPVALAAGEAHQLLAHLITNAIHAVHAAPTPQVRVRLERQPEEVVLVVADNGIGIASEDQGHVFEPFFTRKGAASANRCFPPSIQGSGLGLAVCLALAERAGGRITMCSAAGAGTTVQVRLPVRALAPAPATPPPPAQPPGRQLRIVVLEDNANLRDLAVGALREAGWEVRAYGEPRECLSAWEPGWSDLLLLDWGLPGMDGGEVLTALAGVRGKADLRVLVMSGGNLAETIPAPPGIVLLDPLEKPFRMQALVRRIAAGV